MNLSDLLQNIYTDLGQTPKNYGSFIATGGSATTFVNSDWGNIESPPETDVFKGMIAFVVRDAAGLSASPEGKFGLVSGYVDTTYTGTIPTVTDAIASGDKIMLAKQDLFPLQEVITRVNRALSNLGDLPLVDISLAGVSDQTEYAIPLAVKRGLKKVYVQTDDTVNNNVWSEVFQWRTDQTTAGSTGVLYLPQLSTGYTIRLIYTGPHPYVSAYSDVINEYIHPKVATAAALLEVLAWFNRTDENQGGSEFFTFLENEYRTKYLPLAMLENPIMKPSTSPKYSIFNLAISENLSP